MKRAIIAITLLAATVMGCTKEQPKRSHCAEVWFITEHYNADGFKQGVDTFWHDAKICDAVLDSIDAQSDLWFVNCATLMTDHYYYIITNR